MTQVKHFSNSTLQVKIFCEKGMKRYTITYTEFCFYQTLPKKINNCWWEILQSGSKISSKVAILPIVSENFETQRPIGISQHIALSVEITDPKRYLRPWSEIWWKLLQKLHQLSIEVCSKSQIETNLSQGLILKNLIWSYLFKLRYFAAQCSRSLHSKLRENERIHVTLSHSKNGYQSCCFR